MGQREYAWTTLLKGYTKFTWPPMTFQKLYFVLTKVEKARHHRCEGSTGIVTQPQAWETWKNISH